MNLRVRQARPGDGLKMRGILERLLVRRVPEDLNAETGFLLGDYSAEEFEHRLAHSSIIFLAEAGETPAGYLTAYPRPVFAPFVEAARPSNPAYAWILDHGGPDVVLLDQIGVLPEFRQLRTARALYDAFAAGAGPAPVMLDIVHAPVRNRRSVAFFQERLGYHLVTEIASGPILSGIYRREAAAI